MARREVTLEERRALVGVGVTLDGFDAVVTGWRNDFATVARLNGGGNFEWAWETVARVVANGGRFTS